MRARACDAVSHRNASFTSPRQPLVAVLDGDGAWLDHSALEHPATIEAEPVLRTQGTNVDDLAFEIDLILGATS